MGNILKKYNILIHIFIIVMVVLLEMILIIRNYYVLGGTGDWMIQSVSFYEYFRSLFYETGDIFPNLALHIGGGQNIYYFAYYGLFSPYLVLLFLIPNVSAGNFLMVSSVLNVIVSSVLLYFFFIKSNYNKNISLLGALFLATSTGFVFSGFQFIMFVQYMPFLILGLFGTKKYLDEGNSLLLIISVVLIITTNYYFSIPSIICLCLYALYYYVKINNKVVFKLMFRKGIQYSCRILLAIIISSFLLLPVIYIILNGRGTTAFNISIASLIPNITFKYITRDSFGLGLSFIVWFSIIYNILHPNKTNKFLGVILLIVIGIPLVDLILNGFLYPNGKVFIAFLPLFILLLLEMFNDCLNISYKKLFLVFALSLILGIKIVNWYININLFLLCMDLLVTYIVLFVCLKRKNIIYGYLFILMMGMITVDYSIGRHITMNKQEYNNVYEIMNVKNGDYINVDNFSLYRTVYDKNLIGINYSDASSIFIPTLYSSTYNKIYREIYYEIFNNNHEDYNLLLMPSTENLLFYKFMGVRYVFGNNNIPYGYELVKDYDQLDLYENKNVYSIGFALSNLLSYDEYNELSFIDKLLAYQNNIIIDGESVSSDLTVNYKKLELDFKIKEFSGLKWELDDGVYVVDSYNDGKMLLELNGRVKNKTLVIRFNVMDTWDNHLSISINGIKNTISHKYFDYNNNNKTFDYVISSNDIIDELYLNFSYGVHCISNIEIYAIDNSFFDKNDTIPLNINFDKTKGDDIYGSIDVLEDGYFIFTIPYDKGFTAYVDNKEVEIEQVSGGFIGFKIDKGSHDIHLTFEAPYAKLGRIISLFGIFILIMLCIFERKKNKI